MNKELERELDFLKGVAKGRLDIESSYVTQAAALLGRRDYHAAMLYISRACAQASYADGLARAIAAVEEVHAKKETRPSVSNKTRARKKGAAAGRARRAGARGRRNKNESQ
jgi:hypothetical protein